MSLFESSAGNSLVVQSSGTSKILTPRRVPMVIRDNNLSRAWATAFLEMVRLPRVQGPPTVITLDIETAGGAHEDGFLRSALEQELHRSKKVSIEDNAAMIFPYKPWLHLGRPPRQKLFAFFERMDKRANERTSRNQYGTYFGRMIAFTGLKKGKPVVVNQIDHILN